MTLKVTLVYDYLFSRGGAENLSFKMLSGIEACDFYVAIRNKELFPDNDLRNGGGKIHVLTGYTGLRGWKTLKTLLSFVLFPPDLRNYDCIIYSGEYAPMALLRSKGRAKRNILYCHTIPRAPYDLYEFKLSKLKGYKRVLFRVMAYAIKSLYGPSVKKLDLIIANSENVRKRIKNNIGLDSVVINPPIDTERFRWLSQGDYYLSTARLEPAKRVDQIIDAFKKMPDKKLIVASGGSEYDMLKESAKNYPNIHLTNWTTDQELFELVGNCIATIYVPVDEDFGMSPLESMSAGKPCIGVAEGGLLETIKDLETGWLIKDLSVDNIKRIVTLATPDVCMTMKEECIQHAQQYSVEVFQKKIRQILANNAT